ncbi:HlyD family type I secretion periplasmic adaptor subunit [Tabrizicola sp.]|uniref:HlyD family type I secretion periplasmic adaptor subunit n=1 Tax=Tabrizicola sp. TaxID=2005166 RepID=UPI00263A2842|nr:HlyD family type I secretion periplasmic adaptor subunit [Tabrizicola sp.]MDM7932627.1 HlyD family type I secretion periplasmic adaptor subunit [Tabrizicola sp.]
MTPHLSVRGPVMLGLAALFALIAGFGLWATQARLAGAVIAQGLIVVADDRKTLQHPDGGVVAEILVREGDLVTAGAPLLRLDGQALQSDFRKVEERLTELAARAARLEAERDGKAAPDFPADLAARAITTPEVASQIDGQLRLFAARRATLDEARGQLARRIAQIRAQGVGIVAQQVAIDSQLALIGEELAAGQTLLDKGLVPQTAILALRREAARLTGQAGELAAALARTEDQVTEIELQVSALFIRQQEEAATELREIGPVILELSETRRALQDRIDRLEVRAPVSGIVLGLQVSAQSVLRAAEPILTLVPHGSPLAIAVRIAPLHIDAVTVGQSAEVVLSALSSAETPRLLAHVTLVSADALNDPQTGSAYYLARLVLHPQELARLDAKALLPGMPVEVYLQTGTRAPLVYLLEPFTAYFSRALRES